MGSPDASLVTQGAAAEHSRFVQRVRRRYGDELGLLPPGAPDVAAVQELVDVLGI